MCRRSEINLLHKEKRVLKEERNRLSSKNGRAKRGKGLNANGNFFQVGAVTWGEKEARIVSE